MVFNGSTICAITHNPRAKINWPYCIKIGFFSIYVFYIVSDIFNKHKYFDMSETFALLLKVTVVLKEEIWISI